MQDDGKKDLTGRRSFATGAALLGAAALFTKSNEAKATDTFAQSIVIGSGGTAPAGAIYSDQTWGMLFRAKQLNPSIQFGWSDASATFNGWFMAIDGTGNLGVGAISSLPYAAQLQSHSSSASKPALRLSDNASYTLDVQRWSGYASAAGVAIMGTGGTMNMALGVNGSEIVTINTGGATIAGALSTTGAIVANTGLFAKSGSAISVAAFGAVGDYNPVAGTGTDDTAHIQAALDACIALGGGTVLLENKRYKITSQLYIPLGVTLRGPHGKVQSGWRGTNTTGLTQDAVAESNGGISFVNMVGALWICFDAGVISGSTATDAAAVDAYLSTRQGALRNKGTIEGCYIFQKNYRDQLGSSYTDWANWGSTQAGGTMSGVAIEQLADDACVHNCFIGGFMQAAFCYAQQRGLYSDLLIDCINGIEASQVYDVMTIRGVNAVPLTAYNYSLGSPVRRGTFIYLHDRVDWPQISNCFTYGHKVGYRLRYVEGMQMDNCAADNTDVETAGYYGLKLETGAANLGVSNFKAANREYGVYSDIAASSTQVTISGLVGANCNTTLYVNSGNCTVLGGYYSAPNTGTRVGINNAGSGVVKVVNPTFVNCTSNTSGTVSVV
jgi:hypothetical protein